MPVYMLGNFDRIGGYNISQKVLQPPAGVFMVYTYVQGYDSQPLLWNSGFNTIQNIIPYGAIVTIFTDSLNAPSAFVWIIQNSDYGSVASIISNTQTEQSDGTIGKLYVENIAYQVDEVNQLNQVWQIITLDNLGQFQQQPFYPITQKTPYIVLTDFLVMPLSFLLTQYNVIAFQMDYASDVINMNFRLKKTSNYKY